MKRSAVLLAAAVMAIVLASCSILPESSSSQSEEKLEGQEIVERAMVRYCEQKSGGYEAYDNMTGRLLERFVYSYDEVGFLAFLCETYDDNGDVYKEYNTGYAVYIEEKGEGSKLSKSDERFVVYNDSLSTHPKVSDRIFGFIVSGVADIDRVNNADGSYQYTYVYDPDEAGIQVDGGKLSSYSMTYKVNASDEVYEFEQKASGTLDNGEDLNYDYTIKLITSDSVGIIENPITVTEDLSETAAQE